MNKDLKILVRIDDVCPTMNWANFWRAISIMEKYGIHPILGVVPNNEDDNLIRDIENSNFWNEIKGLQAKGCKLSQHGYNHKYTNHLGGILKCNKNSESVGQSVAEQKQKIEMGLQILHDNGIQVDMYMAPSHSFDKNTLLALKQLGFKYITDGYTTFPYSYMGITFIPCMNTFAMTKNPKGLRTLCLHTSTMSETDFNLFEQTLEKYRENLINFEQAQDISVKRHFKLNQFYWMKRRDAISILSKIKRKFKEKK